METDDTWFYLMPSAVSAKGFSQNTSLPAAKLENNQFDFNFNFKIFQTPLYHNGLVRRGWSDHLQGIKEMSTAEDRTSIKIIWCLKDDDDKENVKNEVQTRTACTLWSCKPCSRSLGRRNVTEEERAHWSLTAAHLEITLISILARGLIVQQTQIKDLKNPKIYAT